MRLLSIFSSKEASEIFVKTLFQSRHIHALITVKGKIQKLPNFHLK